MTQILMPKLGLTMTEGLLTEWLVKPGQAFSAGDALFVVETEKVANEVQAELSSTIIELLVQEGETVPVGTPLASLEGGEGEASSPAPRRVAAVAEEESPPSSAQSTGRDPAPAPAPRTRGPSGARIIATPLARRVAARQGVDLAGVEGSGINGRIKHADVLNAVAGADKGEAGPAGDGELVPLDAVRAATARKVSAAKREVPHFYLTKNVEISALQKLRSDLNSADAEAPRISVTHLLVKAVALALANMPAMNRIWTDNGLLRLASYDVGIVSETANGLRIPVIRGANGLTLDGIAAMARQLARRIEEGKLGPGDVGGGALSISNVGMFGVDSLTPIISVPQSMILGVGAEQMVFRPDAKGAPVACREIVLTLAADHRVIDGADAARFLALAAEYLEHPARLTRVDETPSK